MITYQNHIFQSTMVPWDQKKILSEEITEYLKDEGKYDEIRIDLMNLIRHHEDYQTKVEEQFKNECIRFCENAIDLSESRQTLRSKLTDKFTKKYSPTGVALRGIISQILETKRREILTKYNESARKYLLETYTDLKKENGSEDMEICSDHETSPARPPSSNISPPRSSPYSDAVITPPPVSPIISSQPIDRPMDTSPPRISPVNSTQPNDSPRNRTQPSGSPLNKIQPQSNLNDITQPIYSPINSTSPSDNYDIFSDISSVKTDDLNEYEDELELNEKEAEIVGKSKAKISEIEEQVNSLHQKQIRSKRQSKPNSRYVNDIFSK